MKWYRPIKELQEYNNKIGLLATIAVLGLTLSLVAIIFAVGKDRNGDS